MRGTLSKDGFTYNNIDVDLTETPLPDGSAVWSGTIHGFAGVIPLNTGEHVLKLDDGRSGAVKITDVTKGIAKFVGIQP